MRWLIVGPYAPERGAGARWTTLAAVERIDAGDDVTVVSPRPSAAHRHQPLLGRRALLDLVREVGPDTALWARVEPGLLLTREPSRAQAIVERALLGLALRRAARSVLDVGDPGMFPGGRAGALVLGPVDELVVHSEEHRALLVASGAAPEKVVLRPEPDEAQPTAPAPAAAAEAETPARPVPPADFGDLPAGTDRERLEAAIRARVRAVEVSRDQPA